MKVKEDNFSCGDMVLRWDVRKEKKCKQGKFDNLWLGPFIILNILENKTFMLQTMEGEEFPNPVNGPFLKHFYSYLR